MDLGNVRTAILYVGLAATAACANISTFQTGRSVGKNELRIGAGAEITFIDDFDVLTGVEEDQTEIGSGIPIPSLELWIRYGLTRNVDLGLKLYTLGISGEFKAQFAGTQKTPFAAAMGLTVNYFGISVPEKDDQSMAMDDEVTFGGHIGLLDVVVQMILSYSLPHEWLTIYGAPKYISRTLLLGATVNMKGADVGLGLDLWGGCLGLSFGRDLAFYVEAGLYTPIGFGGLISNMGVGFDF